MRESARVKLQSRERSFLLTGIRLAGTYWRLPARQRQPAGESTSVDSRVCTLVKAKSGKPHHARAVTIRAADFRH